MPDAVLFEPATESTLLANAFPVMLDLRPVIAMTDAQFFAFCQANLSLQIERTSEGEIVIMPPVGGESGGGNARITTQLTVWADVNRGGRSFDSSTGFTLPDGSVYSPDASWVRRDRWEALPIEERRRFPPLCPDFVMELRSPSDSLAPLQAKMENYRRNGARLGWLVDPSARRVYVYRSGETEPEVLENPATISGETVLPGFVLKLERIWNPDF